MAELFIKILNVSISACWLILAVLFLRLALKKAPKWVLVLLWGLVAVRLLCPYSVESTFSLIPTIETIRPEIILDITPTITTGVEPIDAVVNSAVIQSSTPDPTASVNPLQVWFAAAGIVWIFGIAVMLLYTVVSYLLLRKKVATAVRLRDNLYQSENVASPFVLGIFSPRIYLPFHLSQQSLSHVIAHEQAHIKRKDHWWKPLGFLLLTIHWFNPLMWVAYIFLCRDIELACDEKVIKELGTEARADYSAALLSCSVSRHIIAACPVAFGEVSVKTRVRSVLSYKKPAFWVILIALLLCAVVAVCFLTNPVESSIEQKSERTTHGQYYLLIGAEDVLKIQVTTPYGTDTQRNTLGLAYEKGQEVHLEALDGVTDLRGVSITAFGAGGKIIYAFSVPEGATNAEIINIVGVDGWLLAPTVAIGAENDGQYYHIISAEGVAELKLSGNNFSGGCVPAYGSTFPNGERVWLDPLDGFTDLQDVVVTALDMDGNILYSFLLVPNEAENGETGTAVAVDSDPVWSGGIAFADLGPNEEQISDFEISLVKEKNTVQFSIGWARTGLTLEYGLRSLDGVEYFSGQAGGYENGQFENIPAGTYRLFVRNTDYTGVPAYENPTEFLDVSFDATGVINFRIS